jgi:3-oxoacyl-[acyl-carrier protein] reductase
MTTSDARWVVVSGASGALGSALTSHYARMGRRVLALDQREVPDPAAAAGVTFRAVDLTSESEVKGVAAEILAPGNAVDLLINAVGMIWNEPLIAFRGAKLRTHSAESFRNVIEANLTAPFIVATAISALMVRRGGGSIVNFSSISASGNAGQAAYSAAKAGVEGLTATMAKELGSFGVRVNAVALGFVDVTTTRQAVSEPLLAQYRERTPVGRLGDLKDVLSAIDFLAANEFVNGAVLKVDGGLRLP